MNVGSSKVGSVMGSVEIGSGHSSVSLSTTVFGSLIFVSKRCACFVAVIGSIWGTVIGSIG